MFFFWPKSFHVRVLLLLVWAVQPATVLRAGQTAIRPLQVADQTVEVVTYNFGDHPQWLLCNVHDDENTSVQAGLKALAARSGRLVELKHSGEREIVFQIGGTEYRCDPNRIFTPVGVKATLEKLSGYNEQAETEVTRLGQMLIEHYQVDQVTAVIALHNNTEGRYAATSYVKGQEYEKEASAIHLIPGSDPDDFFFVTDRRLFDAISAAGFNAVLQNNAAATDDGSLSVYCGQRRIAYVNVEAQHGHLQQQTEMLNALFEILNQWETAKEKP